MRKRWKVYAAMWLLTILLNIVAWNSTAFCDWYISHIFPVWINTYGRVTGLFPFSVGEILIVLGLVLVAGLILLGIVRVISLFMKGEKWQEVRAFCKVYFQGFAWIIMVVGLIMTLNCFILYHASTFPDKYFSHMEGYSKEKEYTLEDLSRLREFVVERCNSLSVEMERDATGVILYEGDFASEAKKAMQKLGETYDNLGGFYPSPKPLVCSDFLSQQYMTGYYFPFSMEANYNDVMYIMNMPATYCHELAHLKGYIYEDEANFIAYLACIGSEDVVFQYAGYLSVLNYIDNDFYASIGKDKERYLSEVRILSQVHEDNVFLTQEEWDRIEKKAVWDTETVDAISDSFTDTTLKLNGVSDGMVSYDRVVKLLLQYYDIYGYPEE